MIIKVIDFIQTCVLYFLIGTFIVTMFLGSLEFLQGTFNTDSFIRVGILMWWYCVIYVILEIGYRYFYNKE